MKAVTRTGFLGYTLTLTTVPKPSLLLLNDPSKINNDILIKINAAAINPVDYKLPRAFSGSIVGKDFCGTVEQIGNNDNAEEEEIKVGDVVYGKCSSGSLAEYGVAQRHTIAKAPESAWKATELAALPVVYVSALQCLKAGGIIHDKKEDDDEGKKKSVLVIGASGGCGIAGLQLCKATKSVSRIVAVCSKKNEYFVKDVGGATEVVDYTNPDTLNTFFTNNVGTFDCVLDCATNSGGGEDYWTKSQPLLKDDCGTYTSLNGPPSKWIRKLVKREKNGEKLIICNVNTADLELVVKLLDESNQRPFVTDVSFSEDGLSDAFGQLKSRRTKGKLVFSVS